MRRSTPADCQVDETESLRRRIVHHRVKFTDGTPDELEIYASRGAAWYDEWGWDERTVPTHRSRMLSWTLLNSGLKRYSMMRRWPVLTSTVTAMPGESRTNLSPTCITERSTLTRLE